MPHKSCVQKKERSCMLYMPKAIHDPTQPEPQLELIQLNSTHKQRYQLQKDKPNPITIPIQHVGYNKQHMCILQVMSKQPVLSSGW